jgi:hypothetical protein
MSMTEQQMEAAERALHKAKMQEIQKRLALSRRMDCIANVGFYNLPFRILYSLRQEPDEVPLSRFYPHRAARAETEARVKKALTEARERQGDLSEVEARAIQERLETADYTPQDQRDYYFTPFLAGWDFSTFKNWDWTGNKIPPTEAERLRAYYTERQGMYEDHSERFAPPALKANDDIHRYSKRTQELITMFDNLPD